MDKVINLNQSVSRRVMVESCLVHKTFETTWDFCKPNRLTCHFMGVVRLYYLLASYRRVFHNVRFCVPSASHDDVITRLSHNKNWLQGLVLFAGGLISMMRPAIIFFAVELMVKPTRKKIILLLFFVGFTSVLKTTTPSTVLVYITLCYSLMGALSWVCENGIHSSKNRKSSGSQCW